MKKREEGKKRQNEPEQKKINSILGIFIAHPNVVQMRLAFQKESPCLVLSSPATLFAGQRVRGRQLMLPRHLALPGMRDDVGVHVCTWKVAIVSRELGVCA